MRKGKIKNKISVYSIVCLFILLLYAVLFLYTMLWGVNTSLKSRLGFKLNPLGLTNEWLFSNYVTAFSNFYVKITTLSGQKTYFLGDMLLNSVLYSFGCTFFATMVPCLVAYATAKYKFKLNAFINGAVIFAMAVPIVGALPSEIKVAQAVGFYDNLIGLWLMKANFLGMYYLIFYATFKSIPWEYAESVFVDGGGHFTVLFRIMLPLVKTTIWVIAVLLFITFWNDYQTPMVFLPSMPTAAYGLYRYQFIPNVNGDTSSVPMQMAGCFILMLPMLLIFIVVRNKMMGNLTVGGIKG